MADRPSQDEVLGYFDALSNWGRWGADDQRGTLNLISAAGRRAAVATVQDGITVSCGLDVVPRSAQGQIHGPPQRFMLLTGEGLHDEHRVPQSVPGAPSERMHGAAEYVGMVFHGGDITHIDAPSHVFWDGHMYNGAAAELVNVLHGASSHAVTVAAEGIVTRGVLLDIPSIKGVDWLSSGDVVMPDDLEAAAAAQGVRVGPGDALLVRTGYGRRRREEGEIDLVEEGLPGLQAACLPWLRERDIALLGCDTANDAMPSGYSEPPLPVHAVGLVALGLWLVDNCDLEQLAATAVRLRRWEFLFTIAPLRLTGATGSPVNPLAMF